MAHFEQDATNETEQFILTFNSVSEIIYQNNEDKGFWKDGRHRNVPEAIALMHSELSEALEAYRKKNVRDAYGIIAFEPDHHVPQYSNFAVELADTMIRIMDLYIGLSVYNGVDLKLPEALLAKIQFNATREHLHGKQF